MNYFDFNEDLDCYRYKEDAALYRLSACFDNYRAKKSIDMTQDEYERNLTLFMEDAKRLPLPPGVFMVGEHSCWLDWFPRQVEPH